MSRTVLVVLVCLAAIAAVGAGAYAYTRAAPATPDAVRQAVPAPIDRVEILVQGSSATAKISAGLPSGCAKVDSHSLKRSGDTFTVTVLNSMPTGNPICTMIYGMYELSVDLASDLRPGATYTLQVNDKTTLFKT
ncbi:MAG: hypothetical protein M3R54_13410 [Chloroflexota bacterium]|nr:hypothetical protein [Chloroflexota bacterium]